MKRTPCTSFLLSPKLLCTNAFDKRILMIKNWNLKLRYYNWQKNKIGWWWRCYRCSGFKLVWPPSTFFTTAPQRRSTKEELIQLYLLRFLQASFAQTCRFTKQRNPSCYVSELENDVRCAKKAVFAASLEGQLCQIQLLINKNDTSSETKQNNDTTRVQITDWLCENMDLKH